MSLKAIDIVRARADAEASERERIRQQEARREAEAARAKIADQLGRIDRLAQEVTAKAPTASVAYAGAVVAKVSGFHWRTPREMAAWFLSSNDPLLFVAMDETGSFWQCYYDYGRLILAKRVSLWDVHEFTRDGVEHTLRSILLSFDS